MKLHKPKHYPIKTKMSMEDWEEALEVVYLREFEDSIRNHLLLLSRISGIKNFASGLPSKASNETDEEVSGSVSHHRGVNEDDADVEDGEETEDFGLDAQKRKQRATDERDFEDGSEEELNEGASSAGCESEIDQESEIENGQTENETEIDHTENDAEIIMHEMSKSLSGLGGPPAPKMSKKKTKLEIKKKKKVRAKLVKKETDRAIYVATKGFHFEVHFKFVNEPQILLAQIAQHTAKRVSIQSAGKIDQCQMINCKENQVIYYGEDPKKRVKIELEGKAKILALHMAGVDFNALWNLQDSLDVSNNIHAMLNTYGVEAARETIIKEINHVFISYGISVNIRHLTLIADFMTHSGVYRPVSRLGAIAESISPFSKMTFETASKFIVEAASHGEVDKLETPSARICLGLPVKAGTRSFDLFQKLET